MSKKELSGAPAVRVNHHKSKTKSWWTGFNEARDRRNAERKDRRANAIGNPIEEWRTSPDPRDRLISPDKLKWVKYRVTLGCLIGAHQRGLDASRKALPVRHVWFPKNDITKYELRTGNPPADQDRPEHLRGLNLVIDIGVVPPDVWEAVKYNYSEKKRVRKESLLWTADEVYNQNSLLSKYKSGKFDVKI